MTTVRRSPSSDTSAATSSGTPARRLRGIEIAQPRVEQPTFAARHERAEHQPHQRIGRGRVEIEHVVGQPLVR